MRLSRPVVRADVGRPEVCAERVIQAEQTQPSASNGGKDRLHVENRHIEALPSCRARSHRVERWRGAAGAGQCLDDRLPRDVSNRLEPLRAHARCSAPVVNGVRDSPRDLSGVGLDDVAVVAVADEFERLA